MMSLLMLLLLGGVLSVQFLDSKSYVEEQLYLNAQNTASSLSLSLTSAKGDETRMKTMINAVFDNGYYETVELLDMNRMPVYSRKQKPQMGNVPEWFSRLIDIEPLYAEAQVSSGWHPIGYVRVKCDRGIAYRQMYKIFKNTLITFTIFMLLGFLLLHLLLKMALVSLKKVQLQAEAVLKNRFVTEKNVPPVRELRQVVSAMNNMVLKVKDIFQKNEQIVKANHEMLYKDELTKLYNRRYLLLKLKEYLHADDSRSSGLLIIFQVKGISEANKKRGYKNSDLFLKAFAEGVNDVCSLYDESTAGRINTAEFSLLIPGMTADAADKIISGVKERFIASAERFGLQNYLKLNIGASRYRHNESISSVFARLDNLLAEAAIKEEGISLCFEEEDKKEMGKDKWREVIASTVKKESLLPVYQPIRDVESGKTVYKMVYFDITTDGATYRYGEFVPMAVLLGLENELMDAMLDELCKVDFSHERVGVELFGTILKNSESFLLFEKKIIETAAKLNGAMVVEVSQKDVESMDSYFLERLSDRFESSGIEIVVNRVGAGSENYSYLEHLKPAFVKVHASLYLDMDESSKNAFKMMLESLEIKLIVVCGSDEVKRVESEGIKYITNMRNDYS